MTPIGDRDAGEIHFRPADDPDFEHVLSAFCPCAPTLTEDEQVGENEDGDQFIWPSYQHRGPEERKR